MRKYTFHPGETLVLNFVLPFSIYDVRAVAISFRDDNHVAFEALATSFHAEDATHTRVGYTLTQAESLQFNEFTWYRMQINVFGPNSSRIASKEIKIYTEAQQLTTAGFSEIAPVGYATNYFSYNDLTDRPNINATVLEGNRVLPEYRISYQQIDDLISNS